MAETTASDKLDALLSNGAKRSIGIPNKTPNPYLNPLDNISLKSGVLGIIIGVSLTLLPFSKFKQLNIYLVSCSVFYFMEFYTTARYNPENVTKDSFLLDDGELLISHLVAVVEFIIEAYFLQFKSSFKLISFAGFILIITGQYLRSQAMITASKSFNHYVQHTKSKEHELVTHGIYSYSRHPSYAGFFWWVVGLQLMILNPISFVTFSIVIYRFFKNRIRSEEVYLVKFFGDDYVNYRKKTRTLIPFLG